MAMQIIIEKDGEGYLAKIEGYDNLFAFAYSEKEAVIELRNNDMTELLERAFQEASKLPDMQQNRIARWLLDELLSEKKWDSLFADSEDLLANLADEALKEHRAGKTKPLDLDSL